MSEFLIQLLVKDYKKTDTPLVRECYGKMAAVVGIATNLVLFTVKVLLGMFANSVAILADAVNNLSDSASSLILLIGFYLSGRPADTEHPYGHARMEYIAGLVVSFSIVLLGFQLGISSWKKMLAPEPILFSGLLAASLFAAILGKFWQSRFYQLVGTRIDSVALKAASEDSRNDILATSAVLVSALLGAYAGVQIDGLMGLLVALFIVYSGFKLVSDTMTPLLGMAPKPELINAIKAKVLSYEHVLGLHDLTLHSYGGNRCYASLHCEVDAAADIMESHELIDQIERDFFNDMGIRMVIHMDPVIANDSKAKALQEKVCAMLKNISPLLKMHDFRVVWGRNLTKVIFDIEVPYDYTLADEDLLALVEERLQEMNPTYHAILRIDHEDVH
jgi:cation diffusion facilitator family transporter